MSELTVFFQLFRIMRLRRSCSQLWYRSFGDVVGSKVGSGLVLKTNWADSFLNMIFENHVGFSGLGARGF